MVLNEHRLKASPAPPLSSTSIHLAPHPLPRAAPSSWTVLGHGEGPRAHCWLGSCGPPSGPCGRSQGGCYMGPGSLHWVLGWPQGGLRAAVAWPLGGRSVGSQGLACRTNSPRGGSRGPAHQGRMRGMPGSLTSSLGASRKPQGSRPGRPSPGSRQDG